MRLASDYCDELPDTPRERIPLGLPAVDQVIRGGVPIGGKLVVTGHPGSGKTTWAAEVGYNFATQHSFHTFYVAKDQGATWILDRWGQLAGVPRDSCPQVIAEALRGKSLYVADDLRQEDLETLAAKPGRRLVILDSLNALHDPGEPRIEMDRLLQSIAWLESAGVTVIAICHPRKGCGRPQLHHLKESGRIEHFGDLILAFHRNELYTLKNSRFGEGQAKVQVRFEGARVLSGILTPEEKTPLAERITAYLRANQVSKVEDVLEHVGGKTDTFYRAWNALKESRSIAKVNKLWVVAA